MTWRRNEALLQVTVAASLAAGQVSEWSVTLPGGACVADALRACGLDPADTRFACGVWERVAKPEERLQQGDRVQWVRALTVDPKTARRQRFASQGARASGLFAKRRPGAKPGY